MSCIWKNNSELIKLLSQSSLKLLEKIKTKKEKCDVAERVQVLLQKNLLLTLSRVNIAYIDSIDRTHSRLATLAHSPLVSSGHKLGTWQHLADRQNSFRKVMAPTVRYAAGRLLLRGFLEEFIIYNLGFMIFAVRKATEG